MPPTTMQSKAMLRSGADDVGRRQIMDRCVPTTMQSEAMGRSGTSDAADDDAERSDGEERHK
jgi:hypothetical protein